MWVEFLQADDAKRKEITERATALDDDLAVLAGKAGVLRADPVFVNPASRCRMLVTGEIIFCINEGTNPVEFLGAEWKKARPVRGTSDQFVVKTDGTSANSIFQRASLSAVDPRVRWAEPNFLVRGRFEQGVPVNDPNYPQQWELNNTGQGGSLPGADVEAELAWSLNPGGNAATTVAIIDSGVQLDHPDLRIATNTSELNGAAGVDDDGTGYIDDVRSLRFFSPTQSSPATYGTNAGPDNSFSRHGTAVSGMAAATGNNSVGIVGIAYQASVLPIGLGNSSANSSDLAQSEMAQAIYYAAGRGLNPNIHAGWRGADILNLSLGYPASSVFDTALTWAANNGRGKRGVPIFISSGNDAARYIRVEVPLFPGDTGIFFQARSLYGGALYLDDIQFPGEPLQGFEGTQMPPPGFNPSTSTGWTRFTANPQFIRSGTACARIVGGASGVSGLLHWDRPITATGTLTFYVMAIGVQGGVLDESGFALLANNLGRWPVSPNLGVICYHDDGLASFSVGYPATHRDVIAVGTSNDTDTVATYSQAGSQLGFVAPSGDIRYGVPDVRRGVVTTERTGSEGYTANDYTTLANGIAGTSFSSPLAAGVCALLLSSDPEMSRLEARALLEAGCEKIGGVEYLGEAAFGRTRNVDYGFGRVNAARSLAHLSDARTFPLGPLQTLRQWQLTIMGNPGTPRHKFYPTMGAFALSSMGAFNWQNFPFDYLYYLNQDMGDSGQIVARVDGVSGVAPESSAGLMVRRTSSSGPALAYIGLKRDGGIVFARRATSSGPTTYTDYISTAKAPYWLRLTFSGTTVNAAASSDGVTWTVTGTFTMSGTTQFYAGLTVADRDNTVAGLTSGIFDRVSALGPRIINTFAGSSAGFGGDGGSGTIQFNNPSGLEIDRQNNLLIADTGNQRIRRVTHNNLTTVAGAGLQGYSGNGGSAAFALLNSPSDVCADRVGNIYIADKGNHCIRRVDAATGIISTYAGVGLQAGFQGDGGLATSSLLSAPNGVAVDVDGNLFIADTGNNRIRRVDHLTGIIATYAGGGAALGDGGLATQALLNAPADIALDPYGQIFIADSGQFRIRRVDVQTKKISTFAGTGIAGFTGDGGAATAARIGSVNGLAIDHAGNLTFSDVLNSSNHRIRSVAFPSANISTLAGVGTAGLSGDGGTGILAKLNTPKAVAVNVGGTVVVADSSNHRIRSVK